jgi:hypothetical protein
VLSVFYSRLLRAQGTERVDVASTEFVTAAKAVAAFFVLWMGARAKGFPDAEYRRLFMAGRGSLALKGNDCGMTARGLCEELRDVLGTKGIYDATDAIRAREIWLRNAESAAWYPRRAVCKFALHVAFNDATADLDAGKEGLHRTGRSGSCAMLTPRAWHRSAFEVIEHVAVRDEPAAIDFPAHFDSDLYPGNESVVDRLGNLTLLSNPANASVYSEWPHKVYFYWSLTTASQTVPAVTEVELMQQLGVTQRPPRLPSLAAAADYLPHLAPLVVRGLSNNRWDKQFVELRSRNLCERVFDTLDDWLRSA